MIHGGWSYVAAAYAASGAGLAVLALVVGARLRHWSKQARRLDQAGGGK
jgi:hypothetical protein